jgi:hypothetical protein
MHRSSIAAAAAVLGFAFVVACGGSSSNSVLGPAADDENTSSSSSSGSTKPPGSSGGSSGTGSSSGTDDPNKPPACPTGSKTTLSGKVYDPALVNPLPHVVVYVPKGPLTPIPESVSAGITCETCADVKLDAVARTITDAKGEFTLEDVPIGKAVPLVVQIGKWRRQIDVEVDKACDANDVPDKTLRLPRKGSEGSMPHIAVTSGACDSLECMLRGIGIDDSEFVIGANMSGHVHVFAGNGGKMGSDAATALWNDVGNLKKYDAVLLSCECDEYADNKGGTSPGARGAMYDYLAAGGRLFGTHYQYIWFKDSPQSEMQQIASWTDGFGSIDGDYDVDSTFPKGAALAEWLNVVGATPMTGKVPLKAVRSSVSQLNAPARSWISRAADGTKLFSVNLPTSAAPANQCGRAMFSDFHVTDAVGPSSVQACMVSSGGLAAHHKAFEYAFFDLTACVQDDALAPAAPGP